MPGENTTAIVQRYLDELTGEAPAEPVVRAPPGPGLPSAAAALRHAAAPRLPTVEARALAAASSLFGCLFP